MKKDWWRILLLILMILLGILASVLSWYEKDYMVTTSWVWTKECLNGYPILNNDSSCYDNSTQELYLKVERKQNERGAQRLKGLYFLLQEDTGIWKTVRINETAQEGIRMKSGEKLKLPKIGEQKEYIIKRDDFSQIIQARIAPEIFAEGSLHLCELTSSIAIRPCL